MHGLPEGMPGPSSRVPAAEMVSAESEGTAEISEEGPEVSSRQRQGAAV